MMRILLTPLLLFASSLLTLPLAASAANNKNPLMRICRQAQGQFWVVQGPHSDHPLCVFGRAAIGAKAFLSFKTGDGSSQAISVYKAGRRGDCGIHGAATVQAWDTDGQSWQLCEFLDGSVIERSTLQKAWGHSDNHRLDRALSL